MEQYNSLKQSSFNFSTCYLGILLINSSIWARFGVDIVVFHRLAIYGFVDKVFSIICIKIFCIGENIFFQFAQK